MALYQCQACGAPLSTKKCDYCGHVAKKKKNKSKKNQPVVNQTNADPAKVEVEEKETSGCIWAMIEMIVDLLFFW